MRRSQSTGQNTHTYSKKKENTRGQGLKQPLKESQKATKYSDCGEKQNNPRPKVI